MRVFLPLLIIFSLGSCADPGPPPAPPEVDYLVPIVADLQLAEAMTSEIPVLVRDSMREVFFDQTLADHNLDRATFDSLLWIVQAEPVWIDSLYSKVGVILTKKDVATPRKESE